MIVEIVASLSVIVASGTAIYSVNAWRREFKGKRDIKLAEEVLALFYQARDAISAIRSPFPCKGEGSRRQPEDNESPEQKRARDRAYVVYEHYEKRQEVFNKLQAKQYQFMSRFGSSKAQPFHDLRHIVHEIALAAGMLGDFWCERGDDPEERKRLLEETRRNESVIWSMGDKDTLAPRVDKVIQDIEQICSPIIMEQKGIVPLFRRLWSNRAVNKKGAGRQPQSPP